jgi:hypothetical protein
VAAGLALGVSNFAGGQRAVAGELGWRPSPVRAAVAAGRLAQAAVQTQAAPAAHSIVVMRDSAVQLAAAEQSSPSGLSPHAGPGRSVVVRRSTAAASQEDAYDPFEQDDMTAEAARMARRQQPAAPQQYDPFEDEPLPAPSGADAQPPAEEPSETPSDAPASDAPAETPSTDADASETAPAESAESAAEPESAPAQDADEAPESQSQSTPAPQVEPPAAEPLPAPTKPSKAPSTSDVEEAFGEPQLKQRAKPQPSTAPDNLASPDALEQELEQGRNNELVQPTAPVEPPARPPVVEPEMQDELPGADAPEPDADAEQDEVDEALQAAGPTGELPPLTPEQQQQRRRELEKDRQESEKNCAESLAEVKANGITNISLDIRLKGSPGEDYPFECGLGTERFQPRAWSQITYLWKASGLCHKPLYFEQPQLERYGHSWGPALDPIVSGVHFFGTVPLLPYAMGVETPGECIYTLGYYRPGSCAPYMIPPFPLSLRGLLYEGTVVTGGVLILP